MLGLNDVVLHEFNCHAPDTSRWLAYNACVKDSVEVFAQDNRRQFEKYAYLPSTAARSPVRPRKDHLTHVRKLLGVTPVPNETLDGEILGRCACGGTIVDIKTFSVGHSRGFANARTLGTQYSARHDLPFLDDALRHRPTGWFAPSIAAAFVVHTGRIKTDAVGPESGGATYHT